MTPASPVPTYRMFGLLGAMASVPTGNASAGAPIGCQVSPLSSLRKTPPCAEPA